MSRNCNGTCGHFNLMIFIEITIATSSDGEWRNLVISIRRAITSV
uniref:Uncharacterized protein n=1 Tax=Amphimedon queenslandica TaxID=400682 RepID=A0A1X7TWM9_AMPQE